MDPNQISKKPVPCFTVYIIRSDSIIAKSWLQYIKTFLGKCTVRRINRVALLAQNKNIAFPKCKVNSYIKPLIWINKLIEKLL